jgi:hypothetical protein
MTTVAEVARPPAGTYALEVGDSFLRQPTKQIHLLKCQWKQQASTDKSSSKLVAPSSFSMLVSPPLLPDSFRPVSVSTSTVGDLALRSDQTASLVCASTRPDAGTIVLEGKVEKQASDAEQHGLTCMLVYDAQKKTFTIERVESTVLNLKQDVTSTRQRKSAAPAKLARTATKRSRGDRDPAQQADGVDDSSSKRIRASATSETPSAQVAAYQQHPEFEDEPMEPIASPTTTPAAVSASSAPSFIAVSHSATVAVPLSSPTVAQGFSFQFPTMDSLRASTTASSTAIAAASSSSLGDHSMDLPSSEENTCAICAGKVEILAADAEDDNDSAAVDASKELRRPYLYCDGCFSCHHKSCLHRDFPHVGTERTERKWNCLACR